jgi:hypothetical protein
MTIMKKTRFEKNWPFNDCIFLPRFTIIRVDLQTDTAYLNRKQLQKFLITVLSCQTYFRSTSVDVKNSLVYHFCHILRFFIKDKVFTLTQYLFSSFCMFHVLAILTFYARSLIFVWTCMIKFNFKNVILTNISTSFF